MAVWIDQNNTNLDKYLHTVRRIEEHREEKAVKELKILYKELIKKLRAKMGDTFADYADPDTGRLNYARLHKLGLDARLLEEIAANMNEVTQKERKIIMETVEQTYKNCYSGMVQSVEKAADDENLKEVFSDIHAVQPEVVSAAVNNPVHGLTLSDQLEKNRADIIYSIKQAVGVGLSQGDRYDTMARRIQTALIGPDGAGGSYAKSVRIARTEAHRVRETGNLDAAQDLTQRLEPAGYTLMKTWHTMKDERVRPNHVYRTKKGWKTGKPGKYNHMAMDGVSVPINEKFKLPSGAETMTPGQSGVAGEDINCRCYLTYSTKQDFQKLVEYNSSETVHDALENDNFVMPIGKINRFMLDKSSKHGSEFFKVGYNESDNVRLYHDIASQFDISKLDADREDEYGKRYQMPMNLGVTSKKKFMSAWIKSPDDLKFRFVTAYRKDG